MTPFETSGECWVTDSPRPTYERLVSRRLSEAGDGSIVLTISLNDGPSAPSWEPFAAYVRDA